MISVVVPVYNVEKYLSRCIESIINQTYRDVEILLIDDGSTDSSAKICKDYAIKDKRIVYMYKNNGGLSDARNVAIKFAKGDYITFVDSDDYIHSTYLSYLLSLIEKYNADIASCIHFETSEESFSANMICEEKEDFCISGKEACKRMLTDLAPVLTAACGKLYKTEIIKKHEFPYGKLHEDIATTYKYYLEAHNVAYGCATLYAYYQHPDSIMHKVSSKKVEDELWAMSDRALYFRKKGEEELADLSWEFMVKFLKKDIVNESGDSKIWKRYGEMYILNVSGIKPKVKGYLLTYFPKQIRYYFKKRKSSTKNNLGT